ncbi:Uncharacterised protein [Halioglobus japonicus]|nr:Uncharacterised protein [Halioglobus japonicus]
MSRKLESGRKLRATSQVLVLLMLSALVACDDSSSGSISASTSHSSNPLATDDQALLDSRLVEFSNSHPFSSEREYLMSTYINGHGGAPGVEALARLDLAIDELVHGAIAMSLNSNPQRPRVHWLGAGPRDWFDLSVPGSRWAFDNPDNAYRTVPINSSGTYVIHGQRTGDGPTDMTFSLINDPVTQGTEAFLDGKTIAVEEGGGYRVTIDAEPAGERPNHMQSTDATKLLFIRSNLGDWTEEEHDEIRVEYLGQPADELTDEEIAERASEFLVKAGAVYGGGLLGVLTYGQPVNALPAPGKAAAAGALLSQTNSFGHFQIQDDECLLITLDPGGAEYFIVPVTDPWMVGIDPARQTSLNQSQAVPDRDGRYTFVVSLKDPGVHNWLDAAGLHEGTMMVRWQRLPADGGTPALESQKLKLSELASVLPEGTVMLDAEEREQQLAERRKAYIKRFREPE